VKSFALLLAPVALASCAANAPRSPADVPAPTAARPSALFIQRANDVLRLITGEGDPAVLFAPSFLAQLPADQFRRTMAEIRPQAGRAIGVEDIRAASATEATFRIRFENMTFWAELALEAETPHRIRDLSLRASDPANDGPNPVTRVSPAER